ncbi:hypothetical protein [Azospirillum endophyticum]
MGGATAGHRAADPVRVVDGLSLIVVEPIAKPGQNASDGVRASFTCQ